MEAQIAVVKTKKYASSESGDTVEVTERPLGGISIVLADGQSSGKAAKNISNFVVRKVINLLSEGVRDGAAARAASDALIIFKKGKVSATLNILSVDLQSNTLVITRNNPTPLLISIEGNSYFLNDESKPIGIYRDTRPCITEIPLRTGLTAVVYSDGLTLAGSRNSKDLDIFGIVQTLLDCEDPTPQLIADSLLKAAIELDDNRPVDDISIVVLKIVDKANDEIRRMTVRLPL